jgi:hypothetical protein
MAYGLTIHAMTRPFPWNMLLHIPQKDWINMKHVWGYTNSRIVWQKLFMWSQRKLTIKVIACKQPYNKLFLQEPGDKNTSQGRLINYLGRNHESSPKWHKNYGDILPSKGGPRGHLHNRIAGDSGFLCYDGDMQKVWNRLICLAWAQVHQTKYFVS